MVTGRRAAAHGPVDGARLEVPGELLGAPGYVARRLYQAYLANWVRAVDSTVTGPQFAVLVAVDKYPGEDQGSLAHVAALDRSTMADVVRRLEERGLVDRRTALNDARRKLLHLTEEGERTLAEVNRRARDLDRKLLRGRTAAGIQQWLEELNGVAEHWESLIED
ncbi:MarR family winged helix-turn-helix transcriptional regulator [Saccharothrix deserti]|uniref:MarR family winged helix-turn-helix transcriptional regulator n=1 Tax=Saccharothrix deserti TaxID=2593674 RepID=UPI00131E12BC|nr:MarR family winged helix-turn-helix transcriptional regulator [Saccharothrix deserti]